MSIIDIAKDLEYFSEKDLVEELQNPSGSYPRYIVLSELEGRKKLNQAFRAREAAMTQPQTTLADETVQQTMGVAPQAANESSQSNAMAAAPSMPIQKFNTGGFTGLDEYNRQYQEYLQQQALLDELEAAEEEKNRGFFEATGDFLSDRYLGRGIGGLGTALLDASVLIPGAGLLGLAGRYGLRQLGRIAPNLTGKAVSATKDYLRNPFTKPGGPEAVDAARKAAAEKIIQQRSRLGPSRPNTLIPMGEAGLPIQVGRTFSAPRTLGTAFALGQVANAFRDDSVPRQKLERQPFEFKPPQEQVAKGGISGNDLIRLGGTLLASPNATSLGTGLQNFVAAKEAGQKATSEADLREAQAGYYRKQAAFEPIARLNETYKQLVAQLKNLTESGVTDPATLSALTNQIRNVESQLLSMQGIASARQTNPMYSLISKT